MDKPGQVSLLKFVQPLLCPGKNKSGPKQCLSTLLGPALGGTSWSSAQPPCSAMGRNCCPVWGISIWQTLQMRFSPPAISENSLVRLIEGISPLCLWFCSHGLRGAQPWLVWDFFSVCVPVTWQACRWCSRDGAINISPCSCCCVYEVVSRGHKLTGDSPDAGTVPASAKLVFCGFFQKWL